VALLEALHPPSFTMGFVHLIPDPIEFNETFRETVWAIARSVAAKSIWITADLELGYEARTG